MHTYLHTHKLYTANNAERHVTRNEGKFLRPAYETRRIVPIL